MDKIKNKLRVAEQENIHESTKETKFCKIPKEWSVKKLGEIGEFKNGINKTKNDFGEGIELVNLNDVFGKKTLNSLDKFPTLVKCNEDEITNYSLKKGDVLFVRSSVKPEGVGLTTLIEEDLENKVYSGFLIRFRDRSNDLALKFKRYCFDAAYFRRNLLSKSTVSANTNINQESLEELEIIIPTITEQEKIADILSTWDKAIELKEKLIEQKKEQKKGLMQRLLTGKVRLPGFKGEWKEVKIKDIGTLKGGSAFPEKYQNLTDGKYPFYKVSDMNNEANNKYMVVASNYIDEDICSELKASVIPSKSIVFAKVGAALLLERKKILSSESCIDNNMMALTVNKNFDYNFVYYLLHTISLSKIANVGALPSLNAKDVYSIKCKIPMDLREQKAIAEFFTLLDREIELLEKELTVIKQQKKCLMQLLLTGKVRVKC